MENFIVSARKYRPATFDTVVGQSHITGTLKNAIKNNHLAQAFLFCGPRGVGKTTCARILAKTINCQNITEHTEACNRCDSCLSFNKGGSMNIHELDAASNNSVDDIRSLVEQVRYAPQSGKYKIYIIDEVHMLSQSAFNAFLKTLEEPPSYAIFILATTEKHKIIPTILSRCQIFDFNRIQIGDISNHLAAICGKENIYFEPDALHTIASKADGALRDALSIFDQIVSFSGSTISYKAVIENLNILDYDYFFKVTDFIKDENATGALLLFDEVLNKGFDGNHFINGLSEHFRNLLMCKDSSTLKLLQVGEGVKEKYKQQSAAVSSSLLLTSLNITNQCDINYKMSKNQRLHVELALLKMCHIPSALNLATDEGIKKKLLITDPLPAGETDRVKPEAINRKSSSLLVSEQEKQVSPTSGASSRAAGGRYPVTSTGTTKLPSLKDLTTATFAAPEETAEQPAMVEEPISVINNNFSQADLEKYWSDFAVKVATANKMSFHSLISTRKPAIQSASLIEVTVDNRVQYDMLQEEKTELLTFLREKLNNYSLQLTVRLNVVEEPANKKPYTQKDKFNYLAERTPALLQLKKRLDLDIEY